MVPFLLRNYDPFQNGTIFLEDFRPFSEMVTFLLRIFDPFFEMVPFLLRNYDPFQKWYHFCRAFLTIYRNGTIFIEDF